MKKRNIEFYFLFYLLTAFDDGEEDGDKRRRDNKKQ